MSELHRVLATAEITPSPTLSTGWVRPKRRSDLIGHQARLHRGNRTEILCGRPRCQGKLGGLDGLDDVLLAEWHPQGWATVVVPSGFIPDKDRGGLWRLSNRARGRRPERGQPVRQRRRAYASLGGAAGGTSMDGSGLSIRLGDRQAVAPPFRIACPICGFISVVSWEGLGLLPAE